MPFRIISCVLLLIFTTGCGERTLRQSPDQAGSPDIESVTTAPALRPQVIAATAHPDAQSPALAGDQSDAEPGDACLKFLHALQTGDQTTAERLLSQQALLEMRRADLQLDPPGGPHATYTVGATRYATSQQHVAHVDCHVLTDTPEGKTSTTVTWVLRRQVQGWRIVGMVLPGEGDIVRLVSFESPDDVARIRLAVSDHAPASRQAALPVDPDSGVK